MNVRRAHFKGDDAAAIGRRRAGDPDEQRAKMFSLRVRETELEEWREHALSNGWEVSALVRDAMRQRIHGDTGARS